MGIVRMGIVRMGGHCTDVHCTNPLLDPSPSGRPPTHPPIPPRLLARPPRVCSPQRPRGHAVLGTRAAATCPSLAPPPPTHRQPTQDLVSPVVLGFENLPPPGSPNFDRPMLLVGNHQRIGEQVLTNCASALVTNHVVARGAARKGGRYADEARLAVVAEGTTWLWQCMHSHAMVNAISIKQTAMPAGWYPLLRARPRARGCNSNMPRAVQCLRWTAAAPELPLRPGPAPRARVCLTVYCPAFNCGSKNACRLLRHAAAGVRAVCARVQVSRWHRAACCTVAGRRVRGTWPCARHDDGHPPVLSFACMHARLPLQHATATGCR